LTLAIDPRVDWLIRCQEDPRIFFDSVFEGEFYSKQYEMVESVAKHRRTSTVGCNGSGKDYCAGRIIVWWLSVFYPAKVIVLGPTFRQVNDIVWNEVRSAYMSKKVQEPWGMRLFETPRIQGVTEAGRADPDHFAIGFSTSDPYNIQGFHSPNLLVMVTEAHSVEDGHFDAIRRLNPKRLLMTGNPFVESGVFYDSHHNQRELYNTVEIGAPDLPNVIEGREVIPGMLSAQDVQDRKDEWGEESALYQAAVLGKFPEDLGSSLVGLKAAKAAVARSIEPEGERILGIDVARRGTDKSVACLRQGGHARFIRKWTTNSVTELAGWTTRYCIENDIDVVVIDTVGVGAGVFDIVKEHYDNGNLGQAEVVEFIGGGKAMESDRFTNRVAESWWLMREAYLSNGLDTEDDSALVSQVTGRAYGIQSDARIKLEEKEKMAKSPDEADALAMTFDFWAVNAGGPLFYG
jgi:phage terminase large subunit